MEAANGDKGGTHPKNRGGLPIEIESFEAHCEHPVAVAIHHICQVPVANHQDLAGITPAQKTRFLNGRQPP